MRLHNKDLAYVCGWPMVMVGIVAVLEIQISLLVGILGILGLLVGSLLISWGAVD